MHGGFFELAVACSPCRRNWAVPLPPFHQDLIPVKFTPVPDGGPHEYMDPVRGPTTVLCAVLRCGTL